MVATPLEKIYAVKYPPDVEEILLRGHPQCAACGERPHNRLPKSKILEKYTCEPCKRAYMKAEAVRAKEEEFYKTNPLIKTLGGKAEVTFMFGAYAAISDKALRVRVQRLKRQYAEMRKSGAAFVKMGEEMQARRVKAAGKKVEAEKAKEQRRAEREKRRRECQTCRKILGAGMFASGFSRVCLPCKRAVKNASRTKAKRRKRAEAAKLRPKKVPLTLEEKRERKRLSKRRERDKIKADPVLRLNRNVSTRMSEMLRSVKSGKKDGGWVGVMGFTLVDLKGHLEKQFRGGMGWDNYGAWHLDHVRPIASFSFTSRDDPEFKACWSLDNLQPLWAADNIRKGASLPPP